MGTFTETKRVVREFYNALENCTADECEAVLDAYCSQDYDFKGVYPFCQQHGTDAVVQVFWKPLKEALVSMQRRMDIFMAGENMYAKDEQWVMSMGHFMGLFDKDWLGIRHNRKVCTLRFAEFNCVKDGKVTKTGMFLDIMGLMEQVGMYPLPPATGHHFCYPGPRNHNGLMFEDADPAESAKTLKMISDFEVALNAHNDDREGGPDIVQVYADFWVDNVLWYGPSGIGATYTIDRYMEQHSTPFAAGLGNRRFNGHVVRFTEGDFACWFGWPNLTNTPTGGYMGLPSSQESDMQVVDVYCREGDKITENWVFIDNLYYLKQQGLDVLGRTAGILNPKQ